MSVLIHPLTPAKTISWASGTSTELFVFPAHGNFQTRDFDFRISTATVEAEETNFSDFSGLTRILLVLKGKLILIHEDRYTKELETFEQDRFDGAWKTRSKGKVQDFNVMFKESYDAEVNHFSLAENENKEIYLDSKLYFYFIFNGKYQLNGQVVHPGDLIEIPKNNMEKLDFCCLEAGNIIETIIQKK
ncbi:MAG: HutD family protein [Bacteroidota bacterium]